MKLNHVHTLLFRIFQWNFVWQIILKCIKISIHFPFSHFNTGFVMEYLCQGYHGRSLMIFTIVKVRTHPIFKQINIKSNLKAIIRLKPSPLINDSVYHPTHATTHWFTDIRQKNGRTQKNKTAVDCRLNRWMV